MNTEERLTQIQEWCDDSLDWRNKTDKQIDRMMDDARSQLEWLMNEVTSKDERIEEQGEEIHELEKEVSELEVKLEVYDDDSIAQNERIAEACRLYLQSRDRGESKQVRQNDLHELRLALADLP